MNLIEFDICIFNIRLRVICDKKYENPIVTLMQGHSFIEPVSGKSTYTLIIDERINRIRNGSYFKMVDKWFDNANCDVWIDNTNKLVYISKIQASSLLNKNLLVQYFVCNLFNRLIEEKGYIAFHSSCVEKHNSGIAFIGPRNSGKTNCMLNMMSCGYNSVTNDKLAIQYDGKRLNGYGVAQDVSIRMDLGFRKQHHNQKYIKYAINQNVKLEDENRLDGNSIHIESVELAKINGVNQVPTTQINYIVFPQYDKSIKECILLPINSDEAFDILKENRLPFIHDTTSFLSELKTANFKEIDENYIMKKVSEFDSFRIIQGENSTESYKNKIKALHRV